MSEPALRTPEHARSRSARLGQRLADHPLVVAAVVAGLAVVARLGYAFLLVSPQLTDDETSFWAVAGNVAAGDGFSYEGAPTAWRPPAYTFLLAGLRLAGFEVRGVQVVQAALGAGAALAVMLLARRLRLPAWAVAAAGLGAAVYPPFVHLSSQLLSENLSLPLFVLALAATVRLLDRSRQRDQGALVGTALGAGLLWGAAILARPAVLPALGVAGLVLLLARGPAFSRRVVVAGALGLAALAVVVPWTLRNAATVGGPVPVVSNEGFTLWVANRLDAEGVKDVFRDPAYPGLEDYGVYGRAFPGILDEATAAGFDFTGADEAERDAWFREQANAAILEDPARFLRRTAVKVALALEPAPDNASREEATSSAAAVVLWVTSGPVLLGGFVGLVVLARTRGRAGVFLAGAAVAGLVGMAVHLPYVRYRVGVVDPVLLVALAALLARLTGTLDHPAPSPAAQAHLEQAGQPA